VVNGELSHKGPRNAACHLRETLEIGVVTETLYEQVSVIGHHAVREDCEVFDRGSTSKLRQRLFSDLRVSEDWEPIASAEGQGITIGAEVSKVLEALRT
jgi:hypothetical protein